MVADVVVPRYVTDFAPKGFRAGAYDRIYSGRETQSHASGHLYLDGIPTSLTNRKQHID